MGRKASNIFSSGSIIGVSNILAMMVCSSPLFGADNLRNSSLDREKSTVIEEVMVTARKREESIQDVPAAITAFSGPQLERKGIYNVPDIQYVSPGAVFRQTASASGGVTMAIRGQVQNDTTLALDPSVGLYIDDVYIARDIGNAFELFDVESVQVLKGPQGTLFGRNTTGGAIVISRNKPSTEYEGFVKFGVGNERQALMQGMINLPVSSNLGFRLSFQTESNDGFGESLTTGQKLEEKDATSFVGAVRWAPSEKLEFDLTLDSKDADGSSAGLRLVEVDQNGSANALTGGALYDNFLQQRSIDNAHDATGDYPARLETHQKGAVLRAKGYHEGFDVKLVSSYRTLDLTSSYDLDGSPLDLSFVEYNIDDYKQITHEATVNGTFRENTDWTVGLFYFYEKGREQDPFEGFRNTPYAFRIVQDGTVEADSLAGYLFANHRLSDKLRISGGVRYTKDDKQLEQRSTTNGGACYLAEESGGQPLSPCYRNTDETFSDYSYTLAIDYDLAPDSLIYATHRRGYRSGGINFRGSVPDEVVPYDPEIIDDFEVGYKSELESFSRPAKLNISLFYDVYDDIQRTIIAEAKNGGTITNVINAAEGNVYGGELEFSFSPASDVVVDTGVSAAIARYDSFDIGGVDQSDNRFFTPDWSGFLSVQYNLPVYQMPVEEASISIRYNWQSKSATSTVNRASTTQSAYGLTSMQLHLAGIGRSNISIDAFVDNIFDEEYLGNTIDMLDTLGWATATYGAPRTFGLRLTLGFGDY